ncbi:hypothetical protein EBZ39_04115 [bacterium]|nr:hypothetical protein [bacterium]
MGNVISASTSQLDAMYQTRGNYALATQFSGLNATANALQSTAGSLFTAVGGLNATAGTLFTAVGSLNATAGALQQTAGALQRTAGALFTAVGSLNATVGALQKSLMTLSDNYNPSSGTLKLGNWSLRVVNGDLAIVNSSGNTVTSFSHNGTVNMSNNWRVRPNSDWLNFEKLVTSGNTWDWTMAIKEDGYFEAKDIKSNKNININGIILSNNSNVLSLGNSIKTGGDILATGNVSAANILASNDIKSKYAYASNLI